MSNKTQIATLLADNTTGAITPKDVRDALDIVDITDDVSTRIDSLKKHVILKPGVTPFVPSALEQKLATKLINDGNTLQPDHVAYVSAGLSGGVGVWSASNARYLINPNHGSGPTASRHASIMSFNVYLIKDGKPYANKAVTLKAVVKTKAGWANITSGASSNLYKGTATNADGMTTVSFDWFLGFSDMDAFMDNGYPLIFGITADGITAADKVSVAHVFGYALGGYAKDLPAMHQEVDPKTPHLEGKTPILHSAGHATYVTMPPPVPTADGEYKLKVAAGVATWAKI